MPGDITRTVCCRSRAALVAGILILLETASAARAESPTVAPEAIRWTAASIFKKDTDDDRKNQPRMNLSGAACVPTTPKFTSCLIANDEKKYAQFFSIDGNKLKPRKLIRLSNAKKDPDAEGVAYDSGFFYVIGSHGRSRHGNSANRSSYAVFRIAVDPATGVPRSEPDEDQVVGVESSSRLRGAIRDGDTIRKFFKRRLAKKGVNIEGIAVRDGRMHLGLRAPSLRGNAFVLCVDADAVFTRKDDLRSKVTPLALGRNTGIRDLAAVEDGVLILAGPTRDEKVPYAVWFWDGTSTTAKPLAILDLSSVDAGAKAEILLPLEEDRSNTRVLVMFDGVENGGAVSFKIPR